MVGFPSFASTLQTVGATEQDQAPWTPDGASDRAGSSTTSWQDADGAGSSATSWQDAEGDKDDGDADGDEADHDCYDAGFPLYIDAFMLQSTDCDPQPALQPASAPQCRSRPATKSGPGP